MIVKAIEYALIAVGVFFLLVASLGLWRLSDLYLRIHAPTKAATLGLFSLFAATAISLNQAAVTTKVLLAMVFVGMTAPVGAHYLFRTAYRCGVRSRMPMVQDDYAESISNGEKQAPNGPE